MLADCEPASYLDRGGAASWSNDCLMALAKAPAMASTVGTAERLQWKGYFALTPSLVHPLPSWQKLSCALCKFGHAQKMFVPIKAHQASCTVDVAAGVGGPSLEEETQVPPASKGWPRCSVDKGKLEYL